MVQELVLKAQSIYTSYLEDGALEHCSLPASCTEKILSILGSCRRYCHSSQLLVLHTSYPTRGRKSSTLTPHVLGSPILVHVFPIQSLIKPSCHKHCLPCSMKLIRIYRNYFYKLLRYVYQRQTIIFSSCRKFPRTTKHPT